VLTLVQHAHRHRDLYRLLISGAGGPAPRQALVAVLSDVASDVFSAGLADTGHTARIPLTVITTSFVGALLAAIEEWLAGSLDMDANELAMGLVRQQINGLEWALGFQPGEMSFRTANETDPFLNAAS
jgi:hypothetical protein